MSEFVALVVVECSSIGGASWELIGVFFMVVAGGVRVGVSVGTSGSFRSLCESFRVYKRV